MTLGEGKPPRASLTLGRKGRPKAAAGRPKAAFRKAPPKGRKGPERAGKWPPKGQKTARGEADRRDGAPWARGGLAVFLGPGGASKPRGPKDRGTRAEQKCRKASFIYKTNPQKAKSLCFSKCFSKWLFSGA